MLPDHLVHAQIENRLRLMTLIRGRFHLKYFTIKDVNNFGVTSKGRYFYSKGSVHTLVRMGWLDRIDKTKYRVSTKGLVFMDKRDYFELAEAERLEL